jgi:hypothetical protein
VGVRRDGNDGSLEGWDYSFFEMHPPFSLAIEDEFDGEDENEAPGELGGAMPIGFRREPSIGFVHYRHAIDPLLSREARCPAR